MLDIATVPAEHFTFSVLPASRAQKRFALAVGFAIFVAFFFVVGPLSDVQTGRIDAFVPAYATAMFVIDAITAVLLFAEFSIIRTRALLVISSGYIFNALIVIPWILTFPGAFAAEGLIGGLESTPYIYFFWHAGFPTFVIAYALLKDEAPIKRYSHGTKIWWLTLSLVLIAGAVFVAVSVLTLSNPILPSLQSDPLSANSRWFYLAIPTELISTSALIMLWTKRRSTLDYWLIVVMCAYGIEITLSLFPISARFTFNWYAGKVSSLLSSSLVLFALLYEITSLYMRLQDALRTAKRADHAKSSFLSAASHDLRQPLQTLRILHRTLTPRIQDAQARTMLSGIERSVDTMSSMLNNLLDINQLESGTLAPSMSAFPVNEVFDSVTADFLERATEKGLKLRVVRSRVAIYSDRYMLEEMIRNLLSNAVRYTDRGKIVVGCRHAGDKVRIEVWDSGVGIMGEHITHIFDEFYQVTDGADRGGVGLGLAIVERLGKLLDHHISVRSVHGKGSGFAIEVPLADDKAVAEDQYRTPLANVDTPFNGTILLIEDERDVRDALDELLRSEGLDVLSAATGSDALDLVNDKSIRPDLVISDYNLPGKMNGIESIEALRTALAWKIPAIVLTGDIRSRVTKSIIAHELGVAAKPFKADELLQLIKNHARSSAQSDSHKVGSSHA